MIKSKYKILVLGIIIFSVGLSMEIITTVIAEKNPSCKESLTRNFDPNTVITVSCSVVEDVGQDLTLKTVLYHPTSESFDMPAHVTIKDPNGIVLYDMNFNNKSIISFEPKKHGMYIATIKILESKNYRNLGYVYYAFGFLADEDVNNPVGKTLGIITLSGNVVFFVGIGIVIYGIINTIRKKESVITPMKNEPVNITRQTIYAIIPILDLYAAYKIEKFRLYFIIMLGMELGVAFGIKMVLSFPYTTIIGEVVTIPIAVYLIRKWSNERNRKFDSQQSTSTNS